MPASVMAWLYGWRHMAARPQWCHRLPLLRIVVAHGTSRAFCPWAMGTVGRWWFTMVRVPVLHTRPVPTTPILECCTYESLVVIHERKHHFAVVHSYCVATTYMTMKRCSRRGETDNKNKQV